ncbi:MAG: hypothetical protein CEE38_21750 [Planctomycetes bacterium B3_Pla]|nr:MAG: hypothetical protein CEE38_21750 [Planctomycetes bacterium B3_Pla]
MAKPGPKKTPTPVLRLRGSRLVKHRKDIEIKSQRPRCPVWLSTVAKREWRRIVPILGNMGILAEIDREMLALYCEAHADYLEAKALVMGVLVKTAEKTVTKTDGTTVKSGGTLIQHPALSIRNQAWKRLKDICAEFGMSPSSRTGLGNVQMSVKDNNKARFFESPRGHA